MSSLSHIRESFAMITSWRRWKSYADACISQKTLRVLHSWPVCFNFVHTSSSVGTSAPELFASLIGTFIKNSDVGVGAIIGSCLFNNMVIVGRLSVSYLFHC